MRRRWIEARTGYPAEALFAQTLLERSASVEPGDAKVSDESTEAGENRHALGR